MMLDADLRELLALLIANQVEFLVAGGHAVAFHGYPRFTEDLDLYVRPSPENAARVMAALQTLGFGNVGIAAEDFVADDRVIQLGRAPNRVDLLTRLWGIDFDGAWARRVTGTLDEIPVSMLSKTDLIRNKRATARPQDLADAAALEALDEP
ncbi:MAG: nucleotidyltransferase family protein [Gemmatimonas sp.]|nr:nucleotidyltransferase family protein [Gemmatimonas sp.]